jgi:thiol-disulfide isomerase/thioredoxin
MNPFPHCHRMLAGLLLLSALGTANLAQSQTLAETTTPDIQGISVSGAPFKLDKLRGKVVMVMHWSSDCPVCLDKMRELRLNTEGWAGKPFEVVLINSDRSLEAVKEYQRIVNVTLPPALKFTQLWQKAPEFRQSPWVEIGRQPVTWILDKQGKLVGKHQGRLPLEVWDQIADLL